MKEDNQQIQVEPSHYDGLKYDNKLRWISYWHQINEIMKLQPDTVLEIGIGNGVASKYLKDRGLNITTMDIEERLEPDKVGSILNIPFSSSTFDVVACFEVLEHLPYEEFKIALGELERVTNEFVLISVPDCSRAIRFKIDIPRMGKYQKIFPFPRLKAPVHEFDGQHYWEIGKKGFSLSKIKQDMRRGKLKIKKTYRLFENPKHRFFLFNCSSKS